ncbi:MAG TPA: TetR/AcrR family transcriptional regulator [Bacteroidales bacterium]|nr:TetR/AcrR family transcriptional regulator [Bacteroidales bacterium]
MDTRDKIIEEAAYMFRTYGIRAVTMDMLAGEMGISKRTIYEIFRDKDELLQGVMKWMAFKQVELTDKYLQNSANVIEAIFGIMDNMMDHIKKMSPAFRLDMKRYHHDLIRKLRENNELPVNDMREILLRGISEGVFRSDLDVDITDKCITGMTRMSSDKEAFSEDFENEEVARDFFINYLRGISTRKGLDLIDQYNKKKTNGNNRI